MMFVKSEEVFVIKQLSALWRTIIISAYLGVNHNLAYKYTMPLNVKSNLHRFPVIFLE